MPEKHPKLSQEQKRIKIAEACGLTDVQFTGVFVRELTGCIPNDSERLPVPDYFNDLNACHEMEKSLTNEQFKGESVNYGECLYNMCGNPRDWLSSTAALRAEAFGQTMKLWEAGQ